MNFRIVILSVCFLLSAAFIASASRTEEVPARESLANFPFTIGEWSGRNLPEFEPEILEVLGVDEYLSRMYASAQGVTSLYIGYYQSQRQGDTIHSPQNCLPGSGWEPLSNSYVTIPVGGNSAITVNQYVIQKGLDRQIVLYWYQSHGRVIANEYRSKTFMVYDAVRLNRTDAALVRVVSPRIGSDSAAEARAADRAITFVQAIFPLLGRYLPA